MTQLPALRDSDLPDADTLPCMLVWLSLDGAVLRSNRAFTQFSGIAADTGASLSLPDVLSSDSSAALAAKLPARGDFTLNLRMPRARNASWADAWLDCNARWLPEQGCYLCALHDVTASRLAELSALARADQFQLLADNVPVLISSFEAGSFRCLFANKLYAHTFGFDESSVIGRTFAEIIGADAAAVIQPYVDYVLFEHKATSYERELRGPDGKRHWLEVNLIPHLGPDATMLAAFVLITDITKHRLAEQAVRESEGRLAKFMQASVEGIVFHMNGRLTDANGPLCDLVGYTLDELVGRDVLDFVPSDQVSKVSAIMEAGEETAYESVILHKDGRRLPIEFIVRTIERHGERMRMSIVRDIRDRHAAQAHIHHMAHHDALTGLPNRVSLMEHLGHMIAAARRNDSQVALLFIDLDHFKRVNDSLGHLVGDTLLQTLARRITESLRATDVVARFGGDEFIVLLPRTLQRMDVEEVAQKLLAAIEVPVNADGRLISVTPSIGISMFPHDGETGDDLIKNADTAMYLAKSRGRANFQFFTSEMASSAYDALVLESQMAQALARGEFVLHFQPQVRSRDGVLVGAEALIRWNHPERGLLLPDAFIPLAEQQRLMLPIGQWVLREAARCARRWHELGMVGVPVAVNLSTVQFQTSGFTALIEQLLAEEGVSGALLEFELTERMLMDDLPEVKRKLSELKALGIRISVDDFGTGYSSLAHLKELPIDKMKIDRSFVLGLPSETDSAAIARAIVQMARGLGLSVIAEGVETEAQRHFLTRLDCDELQGTLISVPLPLADFESWVAARSLKPF
ncbi:MAG: EAL domain-containing protein [Cytophagales bacterium]|nr:EAL domain-containing protein [Rhizobacter sp.]